MTNEHVKRLVKEIKSLQPEVDGEVLKRAVEYAAGAHKGQKRFSGEPYVNHALETAKILASWHLFTPSIVAGLLHDTVEDGEAKLVEVDREFGETIAGLVDGVTKVSQVKLRGSTEEEMVENLRKMVVAMSKDLRVVLVKLADRLHNMRTLEYVPKNKQKRIARETLEVYAPLADRLGMGEVKGELEDLTFPYLHPEDYRWLKKCSIKAYESAKEDIEKAKKVILRELKKERIKSEVHGRAKHLYSLYKKLIRPEVGRDLKKVYDLVAMRILVDEVADCYTALGVVHKTWKPVPKLGVSDFVAQPKPNGYQSIHTKVFVKGRILEVQIRTHQMHEEAEYGVAAHWHYAQEKRGGKKEISEIEKGYFAPRDKLAWVKQLVAIHKEIRDNRELVSSLKLDALSGRIFVFTPMGDVIDLPIKATGVDFAFAIHSEVGNAATGVKVNGKMTALNGKLKSGDVCEVVTSKGKKKPSRDWLEFVVTDAARRHIRKAWGIVGKGK
jgi:GTP pyrophosphokinase